MSKKTDGQRKTASKGREKSFALQYWEAFEKLSVRIVEELYDGRSGKFCKLTPSQCDGGYDGLICFPISPCDSSELYKILVEAKLRSSSKHDLPLSDFSKTIIIAVNTTADKVFISTNAYFSAETNRRLKLFSQRTGLEINTLDICSITSWIDENREKAEQICEKQFLDALISMKRSLQYTQRELTFDQDQSTSMCIQPPPLVGLSRKALLSNLIQKLSKQNGIFSIQSPEGTGKTVFIEHLVNNLQSSYKRISHLNLNCFFDIREVFMQLLSIAWGIGIDEIYGMSETDLMEVTQYLGESRFPEKSRTTLINMIHLPQEQFDQCRNLHIELLLDYLRVIFPAILKRARCLIVISNLENATRNALDFLCSFMKILSGQPISFLIKVEHRENSPYSDKTSRFLSEIERESTYKETITLPLWNFTEARQFLEIYVPWLSESNKQQLINFWGSHPLALLAGAEALQNSNLEQILRLSSIGMPSFSAQKHFTLGCIDHIVEEFAVFGGQAVQIGLVLLGLFDGEARITLLEDAALAHGCSSPCSELSMCSFLLQKGDCICIRHGAYLNSIRKFNFISPTFLHQVLIRIEPNLESFFPDPEYIVRKRFAIFQVTRNFDGLRSIWMQLASSHKFRGEAELEYEVLRVIYEWWMEDTNQYSLNTFEQYWLLTQLSEITVTLFGSDVPEISCYLEQLDTVMQLTSKSDWTETYISLRLAKANVLNLKSQISLEQADYQNMLLFADNGIALLNGALTSQERNCLGALWAHKALAIKHLENLSSCICFLESGRKLLSCVDSFTFCYYTHLSSFHAAKHPHIALYYLEKIKSECECTLSQTLHTEHNIATMHFILGEYREAARLSGLVWTRAYENNVVIEESRSRHMLGCVAWVENDLSSAKNHFLSAYTQLKEHIHRTHLWPPLINLATVCIEMGNIPDALIYTDRAAEFLSQFHLDSINNLDMTQDQLPKLYVGVLILLDHYEQFSGTATLKHTLLEKITLPALQDAYTAYIKTNQLNSLLEGTSYLCSGKRVLKI